MRMTLFLNIPSKRFIKLGGILAVLVISAQQARPDFWSHLNKGRPETVKLVSKLPPVAARNGNTVRFVPEIAGSSIPPETATILREKIRTLLLNAKAGGIQLVDGPADTVVKCIVTGYEPKMLRSGQRQIGNQHEQIVTWVGNIEASVQVFDNRNRPIDAANLKHHMENDFIVAQQEEKLAAVNDKRESRWNKLAGVVKTVKGGDAGDVASLAGSGQQMHDALSAGEKGARQPTDLEWRTALVEGLAAKVANRIVPVDQEFVAILPSDKEFVQIRELAKSGRWGDVQEKAEKMNHLSGASEAFRLYVLGLSDEALACQEADSPDKAAESLNKASKYYDDANKMKPNEREFRLAQIRAQDSLDHYLEIQHHLQARSKGATPATQVSANPVVSQPAAESRGRPAEPPAADNAANNAALVEMAQAGMTENIMITFVRTAPAPKFDVSASGLLQLGRAKIPPSVIEAVQQRMSSSTKPPARRTSPAPPRKVAPAPAPN